MERLSSTCTCCGRVMAARLVDVVVIALMFICSTQAAMKVNLAQLMAQSRRLPHEYKRGEPHHILRADDDNKENAVGGNPCIDYPDHPFPCKTTRQCLPFRYICDKNFDCDDESDEDPAMCTASKRPPIDEIKNFLEKEQEWLVPTMFPDKSIDLIAQGLAVSPTIDDLQHYMDLTPMETESFRYFLHAVKENREEEFQAYGMPAGDWPEVRYIFQNLMDNGFDLY